MRALVGTAVLLVALAGCGDGDDGDDDEVKACSDLVGETVGDDFEGCTEDGELRSVSGAYDCVDGRELSVVGDDLGWAFVDEEFHEGSSADAINDCYGVSDALDLEETEEPTDEPTDEPTEETSGATADPTGEPAGGSNACEDVWVEGATLPTDYLGCKQGGTMSPAALFECNDGRQLTGYDDRFYAFLGGEIMSSSDEDAYAAAFADCIG